ncbi:MAG: type IX secretion system sortase PorU [Rhodothermales bacterium]
MMNSAMLQRIVGGVFTALWVFGSVFQAQAQEIHLRRIDARTDGEVYEVTALWPTSLQAALDSIDARVLNEKAVLAVSRGVFSRSESIQLPSLVSPRVRILASDYDEVPLAAATGQDDLLSELAQQPADVGGVGIERKRPMATLNTRLLIYDEARGTLRRYRRMVVAVDYPASPPGRRMESTRLIQGGDNPHLNVQRSVLADVDAFVYKISIIEEGIFRIDREFLSNLPGLTLSPDNIDPNTVKVYGNGGAPVPALNSEPRLADLVENPVLVQGGGDGSFDNGDFVLFYGAGPTGWDTAFQQNGTGNDVREWAHYVHPFSNENVYFIKIDGVEGQHLEQEAFPNYPDATPLTQIRGRLAVEMDDFLWAREKGGTGHTYVSDLIALGGGTLTLLDNASLPGLEAGTVEYRVRTAIQSNPAASVFFKSNGVQLASASFGGVANRPTSVVARSGVVSFEQTVSSGTSLNLIAELENRSGSPKAAVDWMRVFYPKALRVVDGFLRFHTPIGEAGRFEMVVSGFTQEPQIWDVTEPGAIRRLGVSAGPGTYRIQVEVSDPEQPRELVAFTIDAARRLEITEVCLGESGCRIAPQDLHGLQSFPQFVIVTPAIFRPYAGELADRRRQEGMTVEVVDVQQIYNEFSGGLPDPRGIRDYFKFLYDRAPDEERMLRYALLFGDGHYNYRNIGEEPELENWILPFETEETFNPESSYTSDDYFGLLDDNEGLWPYNRGVWSGSQEHLNERVDLGIGRLTVQDATEASTVLEKIKNYESSETFAPWRTRYLFLADDGPTGLSGTQDDEDLHTQNTDVVAELVEQVAPELNQKKIYAISYPRVFLNGWRLPEAKQDILSAIREGVLLVNYSGHGGEEGLAQEDLFSKEDARALQNSDKLPIFITATCSFGRWDLSNDQSGAEELLLNPNGGAVAMLTTVRTVYTTGVSTTTLNVGLNMSLNNELFKRDENGLARRLGDVLRHTKNTRVGFEGNNRKFSLLGDPTMRLGLPAHKVAVQLVNEVDVDEQLAPLRALDRITLSGEIQTPDGVLDPTFNGDVNLSVFDAQRRVTLPVRTFMPRPYYTVREDLIWRGKVNAVDGVFTATFVVPKDISYSNKPGRIAAYAASADLHAQGITENVIVGGTADNPPDDTRGPEIDIFLNDETFVSGGLTPPHPRLIVKLSDESGINTVGAGVGHEMLLVLDDDEQSAVDIGDLYEAEENSYQRGTVSFNFEEALSAGPHSLSVRAWDVLNNSASASLDFVVSDAEALVLENVFNYPNPTTGPTRFVFEHNQPVGTPASIQIRIYTLSGRPIRTIEQDEVLPGGPMQVPWDGLDDDLDSLSSGVYLYKVRVEVESLDGERQVSEHIEKLAVIR